MIDDDAREAIFDKLSELRSRIGWPSLRAIAEAMSDEQGVRIAHSGVQRWFERRSVPGAANMIMAAKVLGATEDEIDELKSLRGLVDQSRPESPMRTASPTLKEVRALRGEMTELRTELAELHAMLNEWRKEGQ